MKATKFIKLVFASFLAASCFSVPASAQSAPDTFPVIDRGTKAESKKVSVVATTRILADLARLIGGPYVEAKSLVRHDQDPHTYMPRSGDIKTLSQADIFVTNGIDLDSWAQRVIDASVYKGKQVVASSGVKPRVVIYNELQSPNGLRTQSQDPHAWLSPEHAQRYVANIALAISSAVAPQDSAKVLNRAAVINKELQKLDGHIQRLFEDVKREERIVVTSHDMMGYFGDSFDVQFISPKMLTTTLGSTETLEAFATRAKNMGAKAVMLDDTADAQQMARIASEMGLKVAPDLLYGDTLTSYSGEAGTYISMMRHNAAAIYRALTGKAPPADAFTKPLLKAPQPRAQTEAE